MLWQLVPFWRSSSAWHHPWSRFYSVLELRSLLTSSFYETKRPFCVLIFHHFQQNKIRWHCLFDIPDVDDGDGNDSSSSSAEHTYMQSGTIVTQRHHLHAHAGLPIHSFPLLSPWQILIFQPLSSKSENLRHFSLTHSHFSPFPLSQKSEFSIWKPSESD